LMRRILLDFGRRRHCLKRRRGVRTVTLNDDLDMSAAQTTNVVVLDDALNALAYVGPRRVRVVELRFFDGLSREEAAEVLNISHDTEVRDLKLANVGLHRGLKKGAMA
jgi:RNA polymerase sigma-70 factor, ECF subfamily